MGCGAGRGGGSVPGDEFETLKLRFRNQMIFLQRGTSRGKMFLCKTIGFCERGLLTVDSLKTTVLSKCFMIGFRDFLC